MDRILLNTSVYDMTIMSTSVHNFTDRDTLSGLKKTNSYLVNIIESETKIPVK